ncbi:MAG TPA: hybrid sensor histidine kinase/response regulator [Leucothrix sp.]|nr:hybrid sensor histidine kinase/response regulator [Leucothrix sp.]
MRCRNLCINKNTENNLIQKERFLLLYKLTPIMMLANLLAGSILVGILWDAVSHITLLLWLTTLILMVALTSLFYLYLRPAYVDLEKIPDKLYYYQLPFLYGSIWGAAGYFFLTPNSMTDIAFLIVFLFGMVSGGVSALSSVWLAYLALAVPMLLPFSIRLILLGYTHTILLGSVTIVYLVVMSLISRLAYRSISRSFEIRHKNRDIINDLKKQTLAAEKSSRDKSNFLASASHDLRQPVHSLSLLTSAISPEIHSDKGREILQQINNANGVMLELLNSLLDISKLDAGSVKPQFALIDINELIEALADEFKGMADKSGLELRIRSYPYVVKTDPVLLSTILRNLIQNALLYTAKGKILVSCRKKGETIKLQVWDTGKGIAKEHQEDIFEEFQQLHNPERDQNKGLGLGLAICKRLAQILTIKLTLKSVVAKGSVFTLEIPALSEAEAKDYPFKETLPVYPEETLGCHNLVILVIDDNKAVLKAMIALFEKWDCIVLTASGVEETAAIARSYTGKIDVIIADYRLREETTGVEAINIFNHHSGYSLPSILITGDTSPERMQEISSHGLPVLHKPIKEAQLKVVIERLLRMSS